MTTLILKSSYMMELLRSHFKVVSALLFQLAWFCAVIGRGPFLILLGSLLIVHLIITPEIKQDLKTMFWVALLGVSVDATLSLSNIFEFSNNEVIPWWLILLWLHFGVAIKHGFAFIARQPKWIICLAGAIAGPLSYFAGYRLGAVNLPYGVLHSCLLLSLVWTCLLPVLFYSAGEIQQSRNSGHR